MTTKTDLNPNFPRYNSFMIENYEAFQSKKHPNISSNNMLSCALAVLEEEKTLSPEMLQRLMDTFHSRVNPTDVKDSPLKRVVLKQSHLFYKELMSHPSWKQLVKNTIISQKPRVRPELPPRKTQPTQSSTHSGSFYDAFLKNDVSFFSKYLEKRKQQTIKLEQKTNPSPEEKTLIEKRKKEDEQLSIAKERNFLLLNTIITLKAPNQFKSSEDLLNTLHLFFDRIGSRRLSEQEINSLYEAFFSNDLAKDLTRDNIYSVFIKTAELGYGKEFIHYLTQIPDSSIFYAKINTQLFALFLREIPSSISDKLVETEGKKTALDLYKTLLTHPLIEGISPINFQQAFFESVLNGYENEFLEALKDKPNLVTKKVFFAFLNEIFAKLSRIPLHNRIKEQLPLILNSLFSFEVLKDLSEDEVISIFKIFTSYNSVNSGLKELIKFKSVNKDLAFRFLSAAHKILEGFSNGKMKRQVTLECYEKLLGPYLSDFTEEEKESLAKESKDCDCFDLFLRYIDPSLDQKTKPTDWKEGPKPQKYQRRVSLNTPIRPSFRNRTNIGANRSLVEILNEQKTDCSENFISDLLRKFYENQSKNEEAKVFYSMIFNHEKVVTAFRDNLIPEDALQVWFMYSLLNRFGLEFLETLFESPICITEDNLVGLARTLNLSHSLDDQKLVSLFSKILSKMNKLELSAHHFYHFLQKPDFDETPVRIKRDLLINNIKTTKTSFQKKDFDDLQEALNSYAEALLSPKDYLKIYTTCADRFSREACLSENELVDFAKKSSAHLQENEDRISFLDNPIFNSLSRQQKDEILEEYVPDWSSLFGR